MNDFKARGRNIYIIPQLKPRKHTLPKTFWLEKENMNLHLEYF